MLGKPPPPAITNVHGTCVALGAFGVVLLGLSGFGKSDLALRLIDGGAALVADDRCDLWVDDGQLWCAAPAALAGKIEVRGLGIVEQPYVEAVPILLAVRLGDKYDRMPEAGRTEQLAGVDIPSIQLSAFEASAPAKVRLALARLTMPND